MDKDKRETFIFETSRKIRDLVEGSHKELISGDMCFDAIESLIGLEIEDLLRDMLGEEVKLMTRKEARKIVAEKFMQLSKITEECEPEQMRKNCETLLNMHITLFENQTNLLGLDESL